MGKEAYSKSKTKNTVHCNVCVCVHVCTHTQLSEKGLFCEIKVYILELILLDIIIKLNIIGIYNNFSIFKYNLKLRLQHA